MSCYQHPARPLVTAVALSLYRYNVSPIERATRLYEHFDGACAELDELVGLVDLPDAATAMAMPTAEVYVQHALERYRGAAEDRVMANLRRLA